MLHARLKSLLAGLRNFRLALTCSNCSYLVTLQHYKKILGSGSASCVTFACGEHWLQNYTYCTSQHPNVIRPKWMAEPTAFECENGDAFNSQ